MVKFLKTIFNVKPKAGDKVVTHIGLEGTKVSGVVESIHNGYCWIKKDDGNMCTASFGYCNFIYV